MKKIVLIALVLVFTLNSAIQSQSWITSNRILSSDYIVEISSDINSNGEVFSFGYFVGTLSTSDGSEITSNGGRDYFIVKFLIDGEVDWIMNFGSSLDDYVTGGIGVDTNGDILISGAFQGQFYYSETEFLESTGALDMFLIKLNTNGNILSAINLGSGFFPQASTALAIGDSDAAIIAGFFVDSIMFYDQTTLYADNMVPDLFYGSFNSSTGSLNWVKQGRTLNTQVGYIWDIETNTSSLLMSGFFVDSVAFENDTIVPLTTLPDAVLLKTDLVGQIDWTRKIRGLNNEFSYSVTIDDEENYYIAGYYTSNELVIDSTDIDEISVNQSYGNEDLFIVKYSPDGVLEWYRTMGGKYSDKIYDLEFINDLIYIAGYFTDTISWGGIQLTSSGSTDRDMLTGALDKSGNYRDANSFGGNNNSLEEARGLFRNGDNLYTILRSDSDLIQLGDSIYVSDGVVFNMYIGIIGCLPISVDQTIYNDVETCYGDSTGSILIAATGGFGGPWTYSIDNLASSSSTAFFENLPADDYQVVVIDAEGCTETGPLVSLTQPDSLEAILNSSAHIVIRDPQWSNDDGSIVVEAQGGTGPYTFWLMPDGTPQNFGTFIFDSDDYIDATVGDTLYYVVAVDDNQNCGPVYSDTISIELILGFETKSGLEINVYPNPTTGLVNIEFPYAEAECDLEVLNMTGQMVAKRKVYSSGGMVTASLDLSNQAKGLYMIRIDGQALQSAVMVK